VTFVAPVVDQRGRKLVLKVAPELEWAEHEYQALMHSAGHGSVRALAFDRELIALLEERLEPGVSLRDAGVGESESAQTLVDVIGKLRNAPCAARGLPHINAWLMRLGKAGSSTVSASYRSHLQSARRLSGQLLGSSTRATVLHGDLHHGNLLRRGSDWVAIDPKGVVGPEEVEPAAFLRNLRSHLLERRDAVSVLTERTAFISEQLGYQPSRVAGWSYVMSVVAATWAREDSEGADEVAKWLRRADALRCVHDAFANA
jgi:streptomycin 6-kinase